MVRVAALVWALRVLPTPTITLGDVFLAELADRRPIALRLLDPVKLGPIHAGVAAAYAPLVVKSTIVVQAHLHRWVDSRV